MNSKFLANKKLGQHFLKDQNALAKILASMPTETTAIIEIGPGPGAITQHLETLQKKLILIEKDERFAKHWNDKNMTCLCLDAMKIDWHQFLLDHQLLEEKIWVVSNLPYNISAPLTVKMLKVPEFKFLTLMYQKEVAEKFLGIDGMCSLFALAQAFFEVQKTLTLKPGAFHPPPKVDSMILTFNRREKSKVALSEFDTYEKFLRNIFAYPRKQLNSVLSKFMPKTWQDNKLIEEIDLTLRAEKLSWEELLRLYSFY